MLKKKKIELVCRAFTYLTVRNRADATGISQKFVVRCIRFVEEKR